VFSSSATVYKPCEEAIDEEKPLGCSNPYGWTKFMIEKILMDAAKADRGLNVSILRYFNPVGAHPSGRIGDSPQGIPNNLMPYVQQVPLAGMNASMFLGMITTRQMAQACATTFMSKTLRKATSTRCRNLLFSMNGGCIVHNLGSGKGYSVLEMIRAFEASSGKTIPYKIGERRPGDLACVIANPAKAKADLGWETKRNLQDMCDSAWKWQSQNPHGYDDA